MALWVLGQRGRIQERMAESETAQRSSSGPEGATATQRAPLQRSALHCTATQCSPLQRSARHLQRSAPRLQRRARRSNAVRERFSRTASARHCGAHRVGLGQQAVDEIVERRTLRCGAATPSAVDIIIYVYVCILLQADAACNECNGSDVRAAACNECKRMRHTALQK
jgi:hypothetical protein